MNGNFKDIRLIEAFDYIDPKYIAEVGESLKLRSVAEPQSVTYTKPSPFKYWKQYVALVACVLLLSLVTPIFVYVTEIIGSHASAGTTEEITETEPQLYDEYILTEEDLAQINEAYFRRKLKDDSVNTMSEEQMDEIRNSIYGKYALTAPGAMARATDGKFYFGKYGECFIFGIYPMLGGIGTYKYDFGENQIRTRVNIYAVYEYEWLYVTEAYNRGLLSDADCDKLCDVFAKYYNDGIRYDYVSLQRTYVDYGEITPELIKEINAAWLIQSEYGDPLLTDLDDLMYGTDGGETYLGKYNGYYVFYYNDGKLTEEGGTYYVANHGFYVKGRLAAYREGVIYDLKDLYARGEISYVDVSKMHDKHLEVMGITDAVSWEVQDLAMPRVEKLNLDAETEKKITDALSPCLTLGQKAYITEYYGEYNGAYVFKYKSPTEKYEISGLYYEKVGKREFIYRYDQWTANDYAGPRLLVCCGDKIYTLPEAYRSGLLKDSDIAKIHAYHLNYYPYAISELIYNTPSGYVEELK